LARANDQDRAIWADRVAALGEDAEPAVLGCLGEKNDTACRNAGAALERWAAEWGGDDARAAALAGRMAKGFGDFSPAGQRAALEAAATWFQPAAAKPGDALFSSCARLVAAAAETPEPDAHDAALCLCTAALDHMEDPKEMLPAGRALVKTVLRDEAPAVRLHAVQASVHPGMDVQAEVAALLRDSASEVRRAALLAVGPADEDIVPAKSLLPMLHDADAEVRKVCENVLKTNRHLSPACYKIGWQLYHPDPAERLNVLDCLQRGADVEPGVWLRELSHDDSPAVRLAAVRAMSSQDLVDLSDRLEQMADSDPSPTVCQMAKLYQKWAKAAAHDADR
jgi:HEAT repeats